jgi:glutamate N-acetyltransferase/amino-acid N-acetyltransferase
MKKLNNGLASVAGYLFSAVKAEIRYKDKLDFSLIYSKKPCNAAAVFTTNKVFAAPVKISKSRMNESIHAILINSTNANACTGEEGYETANILSDALTEKLEIPQKSVLLASTGIIGEQLPREKMCNNIPELVNNLSVEKSILMAESIMTTDTYPKETAYSFSTSQGEFQIAGIAKGSGMIAPNMATMLSFLITNAPIDKKTLDNLFKNLVDRTYNAITIDGDMSTNDTAVILAPQSGKYLTEKSDLENFEKALLRVLEELAKMLVKDGEGATKCVKISARNAASVQHAKIAAKAVAESLLVKTALFGEDPNWGRIACAVGYSGAEFKMENLSISFDTLEVFKNGMPTDFAVDEVIDVIKKSEFEIMVDLNNGSHEWSFLTSDISYEYVKINAEYST